ncbi:MAG: hypothetical protein OEZ24_04570, partial [Candidatus Bathyarchaeota archaeon]|nr:hypothetical protein [Candidatus Bathyarchaeota archaeon]
MPDATPIVIFSPRATLNRKGVFPGVRHFGSVIVARVRSSVDLKRLFNDILGYVRMFSSSSPTGAAL